MSFLCIECSNMISIQCPMAVAVPPLTWKVDLLLLGAHLGIVLLVTSRTLQLISLLRLENGQGHFCLSCPRMILCSHKRKKSTYIYSKWQ
ncbi:unnamed protein product [Leptidea sinapis]|uniref:Uncharacterized protein n=1 Tax=Leptidea sinapis TaxID=189913 RepID=A0A5E4Q499_9NEOP|nr:unnamed protein product [Leptidea sinapis]